MNNNSGNGFSSGYSGGLLGMNRNLQNSGGFLGMNRTYQQNQSSNLASFQTNQIQQSMKMKSVAEMDSSIGPREVRDSPRGFSMTFGKEKLAGACDLVGYGTTLNIDENSSDEDEPSMEEGNGRHAGEAKGKKEASWQRMKWTDKIVRFLIQVVASVGEDGSLEGADGGGKRKSGLIRKGKWKTVSKVLIAKGFHVSPQQCEDKFNDLNKRYKKLNDILGRDTSCTVVENPTLLENMHNLSAKAKEDVRKLLSSKHLFYREMCAYHNGHKIPDCSDTELPTLWKSCDGLAAAAKASKDKDDSPVAAQNSKDYCVSEEDAAEDDDDDSEDDMSEDEDDNTACASVEKTEKYADREMIYGEDGNIRAQSGSLHDFQAEIAAIFDDPTKSQLGRREWIKKRMLQLHEERIAIQAEAFDLELQSLKWQRFCNKKELELETTRLEKERLLVENARKALRLKQQAMQLELRKAEAPFNHTSFDIDVMRGKEQVAAGRKQ